MERIRIRFGVLTKSLPETLLLFAWPCRVQGGAKVGLPLWVPETQSILVLLVIHYCVIFHSINYKATCTHHCIFLRKFFAIVTVDWWSYSYGNMCICCMFSSLCNQLIILLRKGGRKGKGLVREHVWMTHGHGQQCGDWLWVRGVGWAEKGKGGKMGQL